MEFFGINGWEILVLLLIAMFIFGPDRLPKAIGDGVKMIRNLRNLARNATNDLNRELGTDLALEDLNPKTLLRKHLLSEEDERALRAPLEDLYRGVHRDLSTVRDDLRQTTHDMDIRHKAVSPGGPAVIGEPAPAPPSASRTDCVYDDDAT